jgi:hypothetical protein
MYASLRAKWRSDLMTEEEWQPYSDQAAPTQAQPGEAGGFLAKSSPSGLIGYLKPLDSAPRPRAAYEKIASDLAHAAGIPVPGVVLYRRTAPPAGQPVQVAISQVAGRSLVWSDLCNLHAADGGLPADRPALREMIGRVFATGCGVMAFDSWLRNTDRQNDRNAVLVFDVGDVAGTLLYLDFANTMDHDGQWTQGQHQTFCKVSFPPYFISCVDRSRVQQAAERIAGLADQLVIEVVQRMPDDFMDPPTREKLAGWLVWRKNNLLPAWGQWYAGC